MMVLSQILDRDEKVFDGWPALCGEGIEPFGRSFPISREGIVNLSCTWQTGQHENQKAQLPTPSLSFRNY